MDIDTLRTAAEQASLASLGVGLLAGFFFSLNPVALAAIPVSLAYVTKAHETKRALLYGTMFIVGLIATHVLLGLVAALGGAWVERLLGRQWGLVLGPLLILLGLAWPGWVKLPIPRLALRAKRATSLWGAFALGAPFSVAICPFCTPALLVLLGVAASVGSALFGVLLLLAFAIGRAVPIALGAWSVGWIQNLRGLAAYGRAFEILGGVLLVASGLYMLNAYFIWIPFLAA